MHTYIKSNWRLRVVAGKKTTIARRSRVEVGQMASILVLSFLLWLMSSELCAVKSNVSLSERQRTCHNDHPERIFWQFANAFASSQNFGSSAIPSDPWELPSDVDSDGVSMGSPSWDLTWDDIFKSDTEVEHSLKSLEHDEPKLQADLQDDNITTPRSEDSMGDISDMSDMSDLSLMSDPSEVAENFAIDRVTNKYFPLSRSESLSPPTFVRQEDIDMIEAAAERLSKELASNIVPSDAASDSEYSPLSLNAAQKRKADSDESNSSDRDDVEIVRRTHDASKHDASNLSPGENTSLEELRLFPDRPALFMPA